MSDPPLQADMTADIPDRPLSANGLNRSRGRTRVASFSGLSKPELAEAHCLGIEVVPTTSLKAEASPRGGVNSPL